MKPILTLALGSMLLIGLAQNQAAEPKAKGSKTTQHHGHMGDMHKEMQMMNHKMVKHLGKTDPEFELRFIEMMIPHHEGAILMAQHALEHANQPELKEMAKKIIDAQEKEIKQLQQWRKEWYGARK